MKKRQFSARLFYILMCVSTFVLALFLGGEISYGSLFTLILVLPAAFFLSWAPGRQVLGRHAFDRDACPRGTAVRYAFAIRNRGVIPAAWTRFEIVSSHALLGKPEAFEIPLRPFSSFKWETVFIPAHRGIYTLTFEDFHVTDPFCLTTRQVSRLNNGHPAALTLTVLPKLIPLLEAWKERLDIQGAGGLFAQSSDEPAVDSRAYRYGDSPRRIHWKLTARQRELMVRQYESVENRRLLVVLNLRPFEAEARKDFEDALIESCLSVVHYALERQIETTLVYGQGKEIRRFSGRDTRLFHALCRDMAAAEFQSQPDLTELLGEARGAQLLYVFCIDLPENLSDLPQDRPVELAVMRGYDGRQGPGNAGQSLRVTVIEP